MYEDPEPIQKKKSIGNAGAAGENIQQHHLSEVPKSKSGRPALMQKRTSLRASTAPKKAGGLCCCL